MISNIFRHSLLLWIALSPVGLRAQTLTTGWATRNTHSLDMAATQSQQAVYAWRGERTSARLLIGSDAPTEPLRLQTTAWTWRGTAWVNSRQAWARFQSNVTGDGKRGCGTNDRSTPPVQIPDIIEIDTAIALGAGEVRSAWVTIEVPRDVDAGEYSLAVNVVGQQSGKRYASLPLQVNVADRTLPEPKDYRFHTDFWQQPYAVSRYYGLKPWSQAHYDALKPYLRLLARSGQKVVTTILFYEPWGEQSNDKFLPMVQTTLRKDGTWSYDYSVFDHYVALCDSCGINSQINCYSMIPWDMSFRYYDEAKGQDMDLKTTTDAKAYRNLWVSFLRSLAAHLKEKGWYEKTCIAMDERGLKDMQNAYNLLQEAVPGMKVALAGSPHEELAAKIYDYSLGRGEQFTRDEQAERKRLGLVSTSYTACSGLRPNIHLYNAPADAAFLPVLSVAGEFDGYLHWSWMNWTDDPLHDARFKLFPAGDTYCIYPGPRSGVRYERYIEGVQQAEKLRMLRQELMLSSDSGSFVQLRQIEGMLQRFRSVKLSDDETTARLVDSLEQMLNESLDLRMSVEQVYQTTGRGNKQSVLLRVTLPATRQPVAIERLGLLLKGNTRKNVDAIQLYQSSAINFPADEQPRLITTLRPTADEFHVDLTGVSTSSHDTYLYITADVSRKATVGDSLDMALFDIVADGRSVKVDGDPMYSQQIYEVQSFMTMPDTYGSHIYRIPAMTVAKNGDLVAACDKRFDSGGDAGSHRIDIVVRRSSDGGRTWTEPQTVAQGRGAGDFDFGFGDPALVTTRSGRIICMTCAGNRGFWSGQRTAAIVISDDGGRTWSEPRSLFTDRFTDEVSGKKNEFGQWSGFITSGRGVVTDDGRVMFLMLVNNRDGFKNYVLYSDDDGESWTLDSHIAYNLGDEAKLCVLGDGSLIASSRRKGARGFNHGDAQTLAFGEQWQAETLKGAACNADILNYQPARKGQADVLLHTLPVTIPTLQRADLRLFVSRDTARTWQPVFTLQPGAASYSTMVRLHDGSLGVLFEDESNGVNNWTMTFVRLSKKQIQRLLGR